MSDVLEDTGAEVGMAEQAVAELGGEAGEESSFFQYGEGDTGLTFKTQDDLKAHLDKSINFESDYTKKSQAREAEYRQKMQEIEQRDAELKKSREDWEKNEKAKYDKYNEILSTRPSVAKMLADAVDKPVTPNEVHQRAQSYTDEKYKGLEERLDAYDREKEESKLESERDKIYSELEQTYPDIRDVSAKALAKLDGNDMRQLIELVYKADKYDPQGIREEVEHDIAKKSSAKMMPSGGGPPAPKKGSTDLKTAHAEALEEYAGITT